MQIHNSFWFNWKHLEMVRGNLQKKHSIYKDIIHIEVDPPPSHPIFDKFIFDKVLIMLTFLPPRIFEKNHDILGFEFTLSIILIIFCSNLICDKIFDNFFHNKNVLTT